MAINQQYNAAVGGIQEKLFIDKKEKCRFIRVFTDRFMV